MRPHRCASAAAGVLAICGLFGPGIPSAAAEPIVTTIPERPTPPGQTTFADNPAIVDSRPQAIESWSRQPEADALAVHFTTGTPECYGVHAEVQETADIIAVKLLSGTVPEAAGRACIMIAVFGTLTVGLDAPVGNRAVVSIT
jgi:hypothetical protein